eukprot:Awhi_evm1s10799
MERSNSITKQTEILHSSPTTKKVRVENQPQNIEQVLSIQTCLAEENYPTFNLNPDENAHLFAFKRLYD